LVETATNSECANCTAPLKSTWGLSVFPCIDDATDYGQESAHHVLVSRLQPQ